MLPEFIEFAKQIDWNACCRTKHKNWEILLFDKPRDGYLPSLFCVCAFANHRQSASSASESVLTSSISPSGGLIAGDHGADIGGQLTGFAHKLLQTFGSDVCEVMKSTMRSWFLARYLNACGTAMIVPFIRTG